MVTSPFRSHPKTPGGKGRVSEPEAISPNMLYGDSAMKITRAEVEHVARLARLALGEDELESLTGQMDAILGYVDQLNELDTEGIIPTAHAVPMENAFREDLVKPSLGVEAALDNAPDSGNGCFRVPKVIE
jgi:aspartyl-tRNA(Asn)/glutamyl-tRNA(Gln) amidotransferase subunit C